METRKKTQEKDASSQCDDAGARVAYLGQMLFCLFFLPPKNNRWLALADAGGLTFFLKWDMPPA